MMGAAMRLAMAVVLASAAVCAHSAQTSLTAQADNAAARPAAPNTDTTVTPAPANPPAGTPQVVQPPPGAPAPAKRGDQGAGRTPDAPPAEDPGGGVRIGEKPGPTSGA